MGKKLDETKRLIKQFEAQRAAELADIDSVINELNAEMEKAKLHEKLATASCDTSEFRNARNETNDIALRIEMYKNRKAALKSGQLITTEEYNAQVKSVREETRNTVMKYAEKLKNLYTEIAETGKELEQLLEDADSTLQTLQRNIFRNGDRGKKLNGRYEKTKVFASTYAAYEMVWEAGKRGADVSKTIAARYLTNNYEGEDPRLPNYQQDLRE